MWGNKNIRGAEEHFRQAILLKPNNERAHNNLGSLLKSQGNEGEAVKHYRLALHYQSYYIPARTNMGRALAATGNLKAAEEHFRIAFLVEPHVAKNHYEWGICLERAGFLTEAIKQYQAVLDIDPNHTQGQSALRRIQLRNWALRRVLKIEPKSSRPRPTFVLRPTPGSHLRLSR